jgi:hypothetical protein
MVESNPSPSFCQTAYLSPESASKMVPPTHMGQRNSRSQLLLLASNIFSWTETLEVLLFSPLYPPTVDWPGVLSLCLVSWPWSSAGVWEGTSELDGLSSAGLESEIHECCQDIMYAMRLGRIVVQVMQQLNMQCRRARAVVWIIDVCIDAQNCSCIDVEWEKSCKKPVKDSRGRSLKVKEGDGVSR